MQRGLLPPCQVSRGCKPRMACAPPCLQMLALDLHPALRLPGCFRKVSGIPSCDKEGHKLHAGQARSLQKTQRRTRITTRRGHRARSAGSLPEGLCARPARCPRPRPGATPLRGHAIEHPGRPTACYGEIFANGATAFRGRAPTNRPSDSPTISAAQT